jgi:hypothetical protein
MHYKAIVIALMETARLMAELSALSDDWISRSLIAGETCWLQSDPFSPC